MQTNSLHGPGLTLSAPDTLAETRSDGSILLRERRALDAYPAAVFHAFGDWARRTPGRLAVADRKGAGDWRRLSYAELDRQSAGLGQALIDAGVSEARPLLLISNNRIEAAVAMLAAYRAGVPVAPVTPAYSAGPGDPERLSAVLRTLNPGMVMVEGFARHEPALRKHLGEDVPLLSLMESDAFAAATAQAPRDSFHRAEAGVAGATVAKLLFTSGSTGAPKGAINTHEMLASNTQALRQAWPFVETEPPVVCDWLPWSHIFGSNLVFNLVLSTGGALHIDDGRPMPDEIARSVENAADVGPNVHVNTPRGLDLVARVLQQDDGLARSFFRRLGLVFFGSAGLPPRVREDWRRLIERHAQRPVAFCVGWGATETGPLGTLLNAEPAHINNIGAPVAGLAVKLSPTGDRYEIRVKGPGVTPGYLGRDDLTAEAFDAEGYFRTGDAGALADPAQPSAGILIEGRLAENFKLSTGVWVNVSALRNQLLEAIGPVARDVVISGPGRERLSALVFLDTDACRLATGEAGDPATFCAHPAVQDLVRDAVAAHNAINSGGSRRIASMRIMSRLLEPGSGEVTEKGTVNQAAVLRREAAICNELDVTTA